VLGCLKLKLVIRHSLNDNFKQTILSRKGALQKLIVRAYVHLLETQIAHRVRVLSIGHRAALFFLRTSVNVR